MDVVGTELGLAVDCLGYALRPPSPQTLIGGIALRGKRRLKLARSLPAATASRVRGQAQTHISTPPV